MTDEYPRMEVVKTARIRKNPRNPNEQDERTFNALCESIQEEGWVEPMATIVPIEGDPDYDYEAVGGHHRVDAATVLAIDDGPCWVLNPEKFDQDRRNWTMTKVNVLRGKLNPVKFTALYNEMAKTYDKEVLKSLMGFTEDDAFKALYKDVRKSLPPGLAEALSKQKGEIKTIDDLSLVLNRLFREHGETLDANYMVFSWAGKEVMMIRAEKPLWDAVNALATNARDEGRTMDDVMLEAITAVKV